MKTEIFPKSEIISNSTVLHCEQDGAIAINNTCYCACPYVFEFEAAVHTMIGEMLGIRIEEIQFDVYVFITFLTVLLIFLIGYPVLMYHYYLILGKIIGFIKNTLLKTEEKEEKPTKKEKDKPLILGLKKVTGTLLGFVFEFVNHLRIPENGLIILLGVGIGLIMKLIGLSTPIEEEIQNLFHDNYEIFIPFLLLHGGYYIKKTEFFNNIGLILLQSVVGTIIQVILLGLTFFLFFGLLFQINIIDCFVFASLLSAIDHTSSEAILEFLHEYNANERLNVLFSTETSFNDVVSILLYELLVNLKKAVIEQKLQLDQHIFSILGLFLLRLLFVTVSGILIGLIVGFIASIISRFTKNSSRKHVSKLYKKENVNHLQFFMIIIFCFFSFFLAESFYSNGVISLIFCTLFMSRYLDYNLNQKSKITVKYVLKALKSLVENMLFLFIGIQLITHEHDFNWVYISVSISFMLVYRICASTVLVFLYNLFTKKKNRFPINELIIYSFAGLRGVVTFILAFSLSSDYFSTRNAIITTALFVIVFTVFINGTITGELFHFLGVKTKRIKRDDILIILNKINSYIKRIKNQFPFRENEVTKQIKPILIKNSNRTFELLYDYTLSNLEKFKKAYKYYGEKKDKEILDILEEFAAYLLQFHEKVYFIDHSKTILTIKETKEHLKLMQKRVKKLCSYRNRFSKIEAQLSIYRLNKKYNLYYKKKFGILQTVINSIDYFLQRITHFGGLKKREVKFLKIYEENGVRAFRNLEKNGFDKNFTHIEQHKEQTGMIKDLKHLKQLTADFNYCTDDEDELEEEKIKNNDSTSQIYKEEEKKKIVFNKTQIEMEEITLEKEEISNRTQNELIKAEKGIDSSKEKQSFMDVNEAK